MDIESSDFAECARILKSSPANELKQHTDDGTYSTFQEKQLSPLLVGVKCSPQQIKDYMKQAGWVFEGEEPSNYQGKYKADYVMSFNKSPRGIVNRIVLGRVSGLGTFSLYDGKITSILMSPSK